MKYEILKEDFLESKGEKVYRIRALKSFLFVKKGDLGGYISSERNLSQKGDCWVGDGAIVCGNAKVIDDAIVSDNAVVGGNAVVSEHAQVYNKACVYGNAKIAGRAKISCEATVKAGSTITDDVYITGSSVIGESDTDHPVIGGKACVIGSSVIKGDDVIFSDTLKAFCTHLKTPVVTYPHESEFVVGRR